MKTSNVKGEYLMEEFMEKDTKIKVLETFLSYQGESLRQGKASLFVRLFGCNLKCPGFGLPKGEKNTEIPAIIKRIDQYKDPKDLPLTKTGCDSYPASYGQFKHFSLEYSIPELTAMFKELVGEDPSGIDLVFTGGEPLLKPQQKKLAVLLREEKDYINKFVSLTFETNGTQKITDELKDAINKYLEIPIIFSMSPKLECSGEPRNKTIIPAAVESIKECIKDYSALFPINDPRRYESTYYFKYVVINEDDVKEALEVTNILDPEWKSCNPFDDKVYLMPCGGTVEEYNMNARRVADLSIKYRLRYCYRSHVVVFRNEWAK